MDQPQADEGKVGKVGEVRGEVEESSSGPVAEAAPGGASHNPARRGNTTSSIHSETFRTRCAPLWVDLGRAMAGAGPGSIVGRAGMQRHVELAYARYYLLMDELQVGVYINIFQ